MPTTCATCRAEVGDAAACPHCGTVVLSPQSTDQSTDHSTDQSGDQSSYQLDQQQGTDGRSDTSERRPPRAPVAPAPAMTTPAPARYPLYADELDVVGHSSLPPEVRTTQPAPAPAPPRGPVDEDLEPRSRVPAVVAWAAVALVLLLVAFGGVWLLFSPGGDDTAPDPSAPTRSQTSEQNNDSVSESEPPASDPPASELDYSGDAVNVATTAVASAPSTAPRNADAFGNRTTYDAANMLDGRPDTCWRTAGDATGMELTFRLASPTQLTRVGLVNGYAKNALVGDRNLNWYLGNRRVHFAQWVFDDGTTVDQPLVATKLMQTIDLDDRVTTATVTLRLVAVSSPGTGRSARDYTAVSEVDLVGVPGA
jgi:hypothetical protein